MSGRIAFALDVFAYLVSVSPSALSPSEEPLMAQTCIYGFGENVVHQGDHDNYENYSKKLKYTL